MIMFLTNFKIRIRPCRKHGCLKRENMEPSPLHTLKTPQCFLKFTLETPRWYFRYKKEYKCLVSVVRFAKKMFSALTDPTRELAPSTAQRKYHAKLIQVYCLLLTEIIFQKHVCLENVRAILQITHLNGLG